MADQTTEHLTIHASPERVWQAAVDFERYPAWAHDVKEAEVLERDDEGRGLRVHFRAAAMGRSASYTLLYDYSEAPDRLTWRLVEGDIMRMLDGEYDFRSIDGDPDSTEVLYHLTVELVIPLPGFVKRRAEARIVHTALQELKDHVEEAEADRQTG